MPYRVVGNRVMHKKGGKWSVKQTCSSHKNAVKAVALLHGKGYGDGELAKAIKKKKKRSMPIAMGGRHGK